MANNEDKKEINKFRPKSKVFSELILILVSFFSHMKCGKISSEKSGKRAFYQISEAIPQEQESKGSFPLDNQLFFRIFIYCIDYIMVL